MTADVKALMIDMVDNFTTTQLEALLMELAIVYNPIVKYGSENKWLIEAEGEIAEVSSASIIFYLLIECGTEEGLLLEAVLRSSIIE